MIMQFVALVLTRFKQSLWSAWLVQVKNMPVEETSKGEKYWQNMWDMAKSAFVPQKIRPDFEQVFWPRKLDCFTELSTNWSPKEGLQLLNGCKVLGYLDHLELRFVSAGVAQWFLRLVQNSFPNEGISAGESCKDKAGPHAHARAP